MPIYDYLCSACDHRADILHGIHDPGPRYCPSCGAEHTMRKQFAAPAVHFKGTGWAKKDRGSSGAGTKAASRASDGAGSGGESGSGSPGSTDGGAREPSGTSTPAADGAGPTSSSATD